MAVIEIPIDTSIDTTTGAGRGPYMPCPKGRHHIKLSGMELEPPRAGKQYPQLKFKYEVVQSADSTALGHKGTHWVTVTPKSTPYFVKPLLDAAGIPYQAKEVPTAEGPKVALSFDPDYAEGAVVEANCNHEQGQNGKTYEKWGDYAVSGLNPRLAQPSAPGPAVASAMPAPAAQAAMPAPAGSPPPRRFG